MYRGKKSECQQSYGDLTGKKWVYNFCMILYISYWFGSNEILLLYPIKTYLNLFHVFFHPT